jgi:lipopolysaccharide transport system ATP-binding protein
MRPIISVEKLGKQYELNQREAGYETLRETITHAFRLPLPRPALTNGNSKPKTIWALKDVDIMVDPGEVLGIVGRNGAGKSTLLKILSRITEPTTGRVQLFGRVASLLEVGTGFHPELSGRENIYLNGAILGMKKAEIDRHFDDIVQFAELEAFIETPVKRYSSGMYMRLAFAVAAHLEPEILLVDEVLAVGDHQFQKKCIGKMTEVARGGRTVLFVSHNMTAVNQLCTRSVMLTNGSVGFAGPTADVVAEYLKVSSGNDGEWTWPDPSTAPGNDRIRLHSVRVSSGDQTKTEVDIDKEISIEVEFLNLIPGLRNVCTNIYLVDAMGTVVLSTGNTPSANQLKEEWFDKPHPAGLFRSRCTLPANFLNDGLYYVTVYVVTLGPLNIEVEVPQAISFRVFDTGVMREPGGGKDWAGVVRVRLPWETEYLGTAAEPHSN